MQETVFPVLQFLGALALFIFGMKVMSEALQKVAGGPMRRAIGVMAANKYRALLSGFIITALIQSSSASTVLLVSFVNAGMITLTESIGVILGANIGTTVTAWLVALGVGKISLGSLAFPGLALFGPMLFARKERLKNWGTAGLGLSLLFLGLQFMQEFLPDVNKNPELLAFVQNFYQGSDPMRLSGLSIFLFVLLGFVLTAVLQSSSASTAVTIMLCYQGWISYPAALAMVIGDNIGTTLTVNIASLVANVHAKRAARAHLLFNLLGALLMLPFFGLAVRLSANVAQHISGSDPLSSQAAIPIGLAVFHSSFNLINVLWQMNFIHLWARIVTWLTPSKVKEDELYSLDYLSSSLLSTPELSIVEARKELTKFADVMRRAFRFIPLMVTEVEEHTVIEYSRQLMKYEDIADRMELEINVYLNNSGKKELSLAALAQVRRMLQVASYLERIGDKYLEIGRNLSLRKQKKAYFTPEMRNRVVFLAERVREALDLMVKNLEHLDTEIDLRPVEKLEQEINDVHQKYRHEHIQDSEKGAYKVQSGIYFSDLLADLTRIADHAASISRTIVPKEIKE